MTGDDITLLIADDHKFVRDDLLDLLKDTGWRLLESATAKQTWEQIVERQPNLVLLDLKFPDSTDLSLLKRIKETYPNIDVIMLTSETEKVDLVVAAIKLGAFDYVPKPFAGEELKNRIGKAVSLQRLARVEEHLLKEVEQRAGLDLLVGSSDAMQGVIGMIRKLATVDGSVLIQGQTGTGKELVARAIHYLSKRRNSPFVAVNCAGIPPSLFDSVMFGHKRGAFTGAVENVKGRFDIAEDGIIFLDEIGDMPLEQQVSILRVIEQRTFTPIGATREKEIRARFMFATNRNLRERVKEGAFREDLFFRINVAPLMLPALNERMEDLPALANHFVSRLCLEMGRSPVAIDPPAMELLQRHDWPGNVRELRNILEGALMLLDPEKNRLGLADLPKDLAVVFRGRSDPSELEVVERDQIVSALKRANGNKSRAAELLGIHRNTIAQRMRYFGITS